MSSFISGLLNQIWRIISVQSPFFGLTYAQIWLGVFVIGIGTNILRKSFSLAESGASAFKSHVRRSEKKYEKKGS